MTKLKCRICKNIDHNDIFQIKEMMTGTFEEFDYFQCSKCKTIQIVTIPTNMSEYYSNNYYSFATKQKSLKNRIQNFILKHSIRRQMGKFDILGYLDPLYNKHLYLSWLNKKYFDFNSKILDVGCGNGKLLLEFQNFGFKNLMGIDPYIEKEIVKNNVHIKKRNIFEINQHFDLIMLHHSFEHMEEPHSIFDKIYSLLSDDGVLLIRIPIIDCYAWEKYKEHWFQLDAPRHLHTFSLRSMEFLADQHKFIIEDIIFDSSENQFVVSENYRNNRTLQNLEPISPKERKQLRKKALLLNTEKRGDQACFF